MGFGDRSVRDLPVEDVDAATERGIARHRLGQAVIRDRLDVWQRRVRQRFRRGDGHAAGHVRDAVMDDSVDLVDGVGVRRRVRRLDASALIDGDVDDDGTRLHLREHLAADEFGGARAGDENRADDHVGMGDGLLDLEARRHEQADAARQDLVQVTHPVDRALEHRDAGAEAEGDDRSVVADDPASEHDDVSGLHARSPCEQNAASAEWFLEEMRRSLRSQSAGDLAHRCEQREPMVVRLDGLVRDPGDAAVDESPREWLVGGDVEVREEHETLAQPRVLGLDRLLDLEEEVGAVPRLVDGDDARPRSLVLLVGEGTSLARRRLDENLVTPLDQLARTGGREGHAVLIGLDLLCNANSQSPETLSRRSRETKPQV